MVRTAEFVLGLLGGIFGFFAATFALMVGGIGGAFGAEGASMITNLGWAAIVFSIVGIVGAALVKSKRKLGGWLMVVSAIGGLISISFFYVLSFVLLLTGGLLGLLRKGEKG